ncbi:acetolactate synthase-1/2/3 large subunit [Saccharopolyspora erythraea NRRL 2338]|uniref:Acetolactate synthase large subunit n=2 Tax=Saccharopolyspora erythraea TaxID=1836 RepID=A4F7C5_SACEN|nr:thiamine pyrophosphate-binding protein [Saccharopolyspora erythraea]EQD83614.1 acetolactate synthase [Saccharopolyspora erythraea D]PFG93751.1 acetolactate synthase-1/2/3 large subunit [Saccharopolyspora erythraea NRRL 2338]QRK90588.1 thiamine pyrophosphate-binding protein [Saccharopolyspora erythraea]CAL99949.1 acetolactate synthase large subunit [Saccharopolyspora erythraea NRRL 2338]
MTVESFPNAWHAVVDHLREAGVSVLFGLPGDDLEALCALEKAGMRMVLCRDQRNAVCMAAGYAIQSGRPGVCVVGKGPAVANAVGGLLEARSAGAPVVVLAGGTGTDRRGSGAFQELDQVPLVTPVVKWAHRIDHPDRVVPAVEKAFLLAGAGAAGPVYLEIPDHLAHVPVNRFREWTPPALVGATAVPGTGPAVAALEASRRPVLLVGGGMRHRNGDGAVESFADTAGAAVFSTASGRGTASEEHPLFCGLSGLYCPEAAAELWRTTDLVVAVGTALEETATYGWDGAIGAETPVVQVNCDAGGLSTEYGGLRVVGDGADVLGAWTRALASKPPDESWLAAIARCRADVWAHTEDRLARMAADDGLHVAEVLAAIDAVAPPSRILVQENGLQDMWSYFYPYHVCRTRGGSLVPSEQTTLGFGAAASAGARLAAPDRPVIAFVGDGAFATVRSELPALRREGVGVVYVVLRNGGYGWLHAQVTSRGLDHRLHPFAADEEEQPEGAVVRQKSQLEDALRDALATCEQGGGPAIVHIDVQLTDTPPGITGLDGDFPSHANEI